MHEDLIAEALDRLPYSDTRSLLAWTRTHRAECPPFVSWLTLATVAAWQGTSIPRLAIAGWHTPDVRAALRVLSVWMRILKQPEQRRTRALFSTIADAVLEDARERRIV